MPGGASTRCGARPQAILHPCGNRGADLIETIRLERLSASLADKGPHPNLRLFIPPHHADAVAQNRSVRPGVGGPGERPWAEKRWTRPASAGQMRVHHKAELDELLAKPEEEENHGIDSRMQSPVPHSALPPGSPTHRGDVASYGGSSVNALPKPAGGRRRPQSAHTLAEMRTRQRLMQQHEEQQERVMRKLKESQQNAAAQQEANFQQAWEQFCTEQHGAVADIERMLQLKDMEAIRRATAHSKEWNEEVFERIQAQIQRQLRKREANGSYNTRWRAAQDEYLRTLGKKDAGVFRDIVLEEEYDPLENAGKGIKYSSKKINRRDPLKLELRKHADEQQMLPGSSASRLAAESAARGTLGRECFDVKQWSHLEATPYGHFNKLDTKPRKVVLPNTGQRVLGDHYTRVQHQPRSQRNQRTLLE